MFRLTNGHANLEDEGSLQRHGWYVWGNAVLGGHEALRAPALTTAMGRSGGERRERRYTELVGIKGHREIAQ